MTAWFDEPVVAYMNRDLEVAHLDTPLEEIARTMHSRGISGLPVLDGKHALVGVITQTDLITLGLLQSGRRPTSRVMPLPHRHAHEVMTHDPAVVESSTSLRHAARMMIEYSIHRVFVTEAGKLAGVICAVDLAGAVRDARLPQPVSTVMTSSIITVDVHQPLSAAIELLDRVHVTGLIVTEDGHPIGMFTQLDALASRDLARSTPIEAICDAAVMSVPETMKLHRVAAHMAEVGVRRVVVCRAREPVGVATATDFVRVVATAAR